MKKQSTKHIVRYNSSTLPNDNKSDWKRVDAMKNSKLERNALTDKDTFIADKNFWKQAKLVKSGIKNKYSLEK